MKNKIVVLGLMAVAAGVFAYTRPHNGVPPDLRDAVADNGAIGQVKGDRNDISVPEPSLEAVNKGYVEPVNPATPIKWVPMNGGQFFIGGDIQSRAPRHEISIKAFYIAKTDVTVEQYAECVAKGVCSKPGTGGLCNWGVKGRKFHPVNCVTWYQANQYAGFKGARLPTEAEWEYAARSGRNHTYPWGEETPDHNRAVISGDYVEWGTMPVCSKRAGNTAQGLCDMAGNVFQWLQDESSITTPSGRLISMRVMHGGAFNSSAENYDLRTSYQSLGDPTEGQAIIGFRLARSIR